jgi:hypothetical protein
MGNARTSTRTSPLSVYDARAMNDSLAWVEEHTLHIGDRVRIRQDRWPLPGLADQVGTVVQLIDVPRDCCLVRLDGDTDASRVWFFYGAEVLPGNARVAGG